MTRAGAALVRTITSLLITDSQLKVELYDYLQKLKILQKIKYW